MKNKQKADIIHTKIATELLLEEDDSLKKLLNPINCKFFALCVIKPTSTEELLEKITGKNPKEDTSVYAYVDRNLSKIRGEGEVLVVLYSDLKGKAGRPKNFYDLNFRKLIPLVLHKYSIEENLENYGLFQRLYRNRVIRELILNPFLMKIKIDKITATGSEEIVSSSMFDILSYTVPVPRPKPSIMDKMSAQFIHLFFTLPITFALYYHFKRHGIEETRMVRIDLKKINIEDFGFESYSKDNFLGGETLYPELNSLTRKPIKVTINEKSFGENTILQSRYDELMNNAETYRSEIEELDEITKKIYDIYMDKVLFPGLGLLNLLTLLKNKEKVKEALKEGKGINLEWRFLFDE